jgi:hypothetical protein
VQASTNIRSAGAEVISLMRAQVQAAGIIPGHAQKCNQDTLHATTASRATRTLIAAPKTLEPPVSHDRPYP